MIVVSNELDLDERTAVSVSACRRFGVDGVPFRRLGLLDELLDGVEIGAMVQVDDSDVRRGAIW